MQVLNGNKKQLNKLLKNILKKSSAYVFQENHKKDFIKGAEWQAQSMYSDKEVYKLIDDIFKYYDLTPVTNPEIPRQLVSQFINSKTIFEQFKKK